MIKIKRNNLFILAVLLFGIFLIPNEVFAKQINAFRFNITDDNYIESSDLIRLQEAVHSRSASIDFDKSSWYVIKKDDTYSVRFYCLSDDYRNLNGCDKVIPLSSYFYNSKYNLELSYEYSYDFNLDFEFVKFHDHPVSGSTNPYRDLLYSADNYDKLKIDDTNFNNNPESAFSIDFPIVASNSTFAIQNVVLYHNNDITNYKYISIQGKPDYQKNRASKSFIILPFDEERNILLNDDSYGSSKRWVFNSNDFTAVKISYDILEGELSSSETAKMSWWKTVWSFFFGNNSSNSVTINVDNFIYTVSSKHNLPAPQRFYSTNGKKYKKLPNDFTVDNSNFYTKYVDTLNYKDGARKGYIFLDLSSLPADTDVVFEIEYSTISLDLKGIEKTEDIDSLTEFDFSNYYGVALVPKFDYLTTYYRYPIYYQGNLLFGSLYNDDVESLDKTSGWKASSINSYSKFLFDLTGYQSAVEQGLNRQNAYLFIKNLDFGSSKSLAKIKYNPQYFELLTYKTSNVSVLSSNGHNYWSPVWDNNDIDFGSIDSDGSTNGIGPPKDAKDYLFDFPTSLEELLDRIPSLLKDLGSSFAVVGKIFTSALSSFPPIITYGLYAVFILGILILIIKSLK